MHSVQSWLQNTAGYLTALLQDEGVPQAPGGGHGVPVHEGVAAVEDPGKAYLRGAPPKGREPLILLTRPLGHAMQLGGPTSISHSGSTAGLPACRCAGVKVCRCGCLQVCRCGGVHCASVQVSRCGVQLYMCTKLQRFKGVQV